MGTWGPASWDNDSAADWFARMFEETKLAEYVERTLNLDLRMNPRRFVLRRTSLSRSAKRTPGR